MYEGRQLYVKFPCLSTNLVETSRTCVYPNGHTVPVWTCSWKAERELASVNYHTPRQTEKYRGDVCGARKTVRVITQFRSVVSDGIVELS